jgi:hypothetical protein
MGMEIFLVVNVITLVAVFIVDGVRKRRAYLVAQKIRRF